MQKSNKTEVLSFLDYQVNLSHRIIKKQDRELNLSKKSFEILELLLKSHGRVITKDELIERIWPKQIVTDAALNKQITRLRSSLDSDSNQTAIIETVRGVGIRFNATIKSISNNHDNSKIVKPIAFAASSLIFIVVCYFVYGFYSSTQTSQQSIQKINIALMPANNNKDWLNLGGINYLSEQLYKHSEINPISPKSAWFDSPSSKILAIEISQSKFVDFVLSINNYKESDGYKSDMQLRTKQQIIAKNTIVAESLTELFEKSERWAIRQLNILDVVSEGNIMDYKPTDYALESYLRGLETARNSSYEKAVPFLQTAINEDPQFYSAAILLVEIEAELGNFNKALALVELMEQDNRFNSNLNNRLYDAKATVYMYLNRIEESQQYLNQSMLLSEQQNDMKALVRSLTTQAMLYFSVNENDPRIVQTLEKQLNLVKDHNPDPYTIALSNFNLSVSYQVLGQYQLAELKIKQALDIYQNENNVVGLVSANSVLSDIYFEQGLTAKGLAVLDKIEGLTGEIDGVHDHIIYLKSKIKNQAYHGYYSEAQESIDKLQTLGFNQSNIEAEIMALSLAAEVEILYQNFDMAQSLIHALIKKRDNPDTRLPEHYIPIIAVHDLHLSALIDDPEKVKAKLQTYMDEIPDFAINNPVETQFIKALILKQEGNLKEATDELNRLLGEHIKLNRIQQSRKTGRHLLDILWITNQNEFLKTLNQLEEITHFKYPILKYKAQYQAANNDYKNAYITMMDLKSKANQFWSTQDQALMESFK